MQIYQITQNSIPITVESEREGYVVDTKTNQFADFLVSTPTTGVVVNPKVFLGQPGPKCHAIVKTTVERNDGKMLILRIKARDILNWNDTPASGHVACLIRPDPAFFEKPGTWAAHGIPLVVCSQPNTSITMVDHVAHCHFPLYYPLHNSPVAKRYWTDGFKKQSLLEFLFGYEIDQWHYDGVFRTSEPIPVGYSSFSIAEGDIASQMMRDDPKLNDVIFRLSMLVPNKGGLTIHEQVRQALLKAQATTPLDKVLGQDKDGKPITIATLTYLFNRDTYSAEDRKTMDEKKKS